MFAVTDPGKEFLLQEGTDVKYGARHLKRAIERLLVQPMSNLIATEQIRGGDLVRIDFDQEAKSLRFSRAAESLPVPDMVRLADTSAALAALASATAATVEPVRVSSARNSRRN